MNVSKDLNEKEKVRLIKRVVFFGGADVAEDSEEYKLAYDTAALLAKHDYTVVNGGGTGIMYAASAGAKSEDGRTLGVTLKAQGATHFEGEVQGGLLDDEIQTVNYLYRTMRLLKNGDAYLVFKGGTGTLSEFAMAWALARIYYECHKSLILVGDFWTKIIDAFEETMLLRPEEKMVYEIASTPDEILKLLQKYEKEAYENGCFRRVHFKDAEGFELGTENS